METRKNEIRLITSDPAEMLGKYTTSRVYKNWTETVVDETGKAVSIERHQLLFDKGIYIDNDVLSEIKFWIEEGSITEIEVSSQKRMCSALANTGMYPFKSVMEIDGKKHSRLLYAQSVKNALDILNDFIELNFIGRYVIKDIKELDYCVILVDKLKSVKQRNLELDVAYLEDEISMEEYLNEKIDEESSESVDDGEEDSLKLRFYQIGAKIIMRLEDQDDEEYNQVFIVQTFSAVRANLIIEKYLRDCQEIRYAESLFHTERNFVKKEILSFIEESKIINVGGFIPRQFSEAYREE